MKQIVSLSGGKDSTAMLLMMLEKGEQIDDIVFFDWGMEFPQMYEHLEKLEAYIRRPITRLYPEHSFEWYMFEYIRTRGKTKGQIGYGWPGFRMKWCMRIKVDALDKYVGSDVILCIGYAYEERFSRAHREGLRRKGRQNILIRYPLLEWGVAEKVARDYCYSHGFDWNGLYNIFSRVSCWCCPFQNRKGFIGLIDNFPDLWQKLLEMDAKSQYPHPQNFLLSSLSASNEKKEESYPAV